MSNTTLDIAPYMKYHIGKKCEAIVNGRPHTLIIGDFEFNDFEPSELKPILRSLKSLTDDEKVELYDILFPFQINEKEALMKYQFVRGFKINFIHNTLRTNLFNPNTFHWLISKGFWLFGEEYFEAGLILES